jgi:hypothetical protein
MSPRAASALPGLAFLEQSPIIYEKILLDVPDSTMAWKPASDRWSIGEVLAHLTDIEVVFRERAHRMATEEMPVLAGYDQNAAYSAGKYSNGHGREQLRKFCHERDRSLSLLRYLPEAAAARAGQHSDLGRITIAELLNEWAFHDLGHIKQISEIYRASHFYPKMGPFKTYYTVKP